MNQNGTSRFSRFGLKRSGLFTLQTSATEYCLAIAYSKTIHHKNCTIQEQHTNYSNWLLENRFVQQNFFRQIIDELLLKIKTSIQVGALKVYFEDSEVTVLCFAKNELFFTQIIIY